MRLRLTVMLCLWAVLALVGTASAEVAFSTSNRPAAAVDGGLLANPNQRLERLHAAINAGMSSRPQLRYSVDFLNGLPNVAGGEEWRCLAEALYFEARGESVRGQFAVAEVVLNRVTSGRFPDSVCGVVHQGTGKRYQCQFTYNCDGMKEVIHEKGAWIQAGKIARLMLDGAPRQLTAGATHYHTKSVRPRWSRQFDLTATIGVHRFYRMPGQTAASG
jgi:spore germination cell wall hydrolase CwlJ-like protein